MSIWKHAEAIGSGTLDLSSDCRFCGTQMRALDIDEWPHTPPLYLETHYEQMFQGEYSFLEIHGLHDHPEIWRIEDTPSEMYMGGHVCPACGWWSVGQQVAFYSRTQIWDLYFGCEGVLCSLDLTDINVQIKDIRQFMMANYGSRFSIHPRKLEEVVGSVLGDLGYETVVTAYSGDGGIDVVLRNRIGERIGVQVKRYKDSIRVEQIRSFAGALMLGGFTRGIFVTTSRYQSGAYATAQCAATSCVPIELLDADGFREALDIAQLVGQDPAVDAFNMLMSKEAHPQLHFICEFHRNSL